VDVRFGAFPACRRKAGYFFTHNHSSNLDFPVIWAALPPALRARTRPIAAKDYWTRNRLRRTLATDIFHAILIERKAVTRENNPLTEMKAALSAGNSLILFPEGTRSLTGGDREVPNRGSTTWPAGAEGTPHGPRLAEQPVSYPAQGGNLSPLPLIATLVIGDPIFLKPGEKKEAFLARAKAALLDQDDVADSRPSPNRPTGQAMNLQVDSELLLIIGGVVIGISLASLFCAVLSSPPGSLRGECLLSQPGRADQSVVDHDRGLRPWPSSWARRARSSSSPSFPSRP
jgi:1-acyl-sn-glycerol-3-phosphate acyltransferase